MTTAEINLNPMCCDIHQRVLDNCDFMSVENDVHELVTLFVNKWKSFMNPEETIEQSKSAFIEDSKLVFSLLYAHYGNEEALQDIQKCLLEEPDAQSDVDEYLHFVENLNIARNITESDFDKTDSKMSSILEEAIRYIQKKTEEMQSLSNSMKNLANSLDKMQSAMESMIKDSD
jgi:hypothetical protein